MSETNEVVKQIEGTREPSRHLVARNPQEMANAQADLKQFLAAKIKQAKVEASELEQSSRYAKEHKWRWQTLHSHALLAKKRGQFYEKALMAVEAGYTLVPNFPIDMFAVRVQRSFPPASLNNDSTSSWSGHRPSGDPQPEQLPAGEGRYVSGERVIGSSGDYKDKDSTGKEITRYFFSADMFCDVQFPIEAAKIEVMNATAEAMALKCFDAVGLCPPRRKGDPLVIGRIVNDRKQLSFLIAWHLDLETL